MTAQERKTFTKKARKAIQSSQDDFKRAEKQYEQAQISDYLASTFKTDVKRIEKFMDDASSSGVDHIDCSNDVWLTKIKAPLLANHFRELGYEVEWSLDDHVTGVDDWLTPYFIVRWKE